MNFVKIHVRRIVLDARQFETERMKTKAARWLGSRAIFPFLPCRDVDSFAIATAAWNVGVRSYRNCSLAEVFDVFQDCRKEGAAVACCSSVSSTFSSSIFPLTPPLPRSNLSPSPLFLLILRIPAPPRPRWRVLIWIRRADRLEKLTPRILTSLRYPHAPPISTCTLHPLTYARHEPATFRPLLPTRG